MISIFSDKIFFYSFLFNILQFFGAFILMAENITHSRFASFKTHSKSAFFAIFIFEDWVLVYKRKGSSGL